MIKLQDAVRYPGIARKSLVILASGAAVIVLLFTLTRSVWGSVLIGLLAWLAGTVLTVGRDNRVMDVALRILDDHPWYTPQEAANAARRELGLREVRYP